MKQLPVLSIITAFFAALSFDASAGGIKIPTLSTVVKAVEKVSPGATIIIQASEGKDPIKSLPKTVAAPLDVIVSSSEYISAIDQKTEDKIKKAVGGDLAKAIEVVRLPEKLDRAMAIQGTISVANAAEHQKFDPKELATAPFAAALHQAINFYNERAQEIPPGVKMLLATTFSAETLNRARFAIDDNLGSLPGLINRLQEQFEDNHAVTVDNIIVFAKDPRLGAIHFWAHEMQHTVQYRQLGVEGFAAKYSTDSAAMEKEAEEIAAKADNEAAVILRFVQSQGTTQQ